MSPTPDHPDDEILSALLDGTAGADPGSGAGDPEAEAAAHLRACDRCAGRQAELAAARAAVASAAVEPLDELARRRLVAGALGAFGDVTAAPTAGAGRAVQSRWISRHPGLIGSAAAAFVALLVGIPFVVGDDGPGDSDATLSAQAPTALEAADPFLGDLGDLGDRDRLRLRLSGADASGALEYYAPEEPGPSPAGGAESPAPVASPVPAGEGLAGASGGARSSTPPEPDGASATDTAGDGRDTGADRADSDACVAALLNGPARGGRLLATAVGTFEGRPAVVAAFEVSGGRVAFVAGRSGCAVLDRFSL